MKQKLQLSPCVAILTALPIEFQAVLAHLLHLHKKSCNRTVYWLGTFPGHSCTWKVILVETGSSSAVAAIEVERVIHNFLPEVVLFVGVAGGLKDVALGDVVAARKIYDYESGKDSIIFLPRPEVENASQRLISWAQAVKHENLWLKRIKGTLTPLPKAFIGPIATGGKVVNSLHSATYELLTKQYSDALALEMEGYGFLCAAFAHSEIDALVIRGISDLIQGKSEADSANSQELASHNASAFAFEVLAQLGEDREFLAMIPQTRQYHEARLQTQFPIKSKDKAHTIININAKGHGIAINTLNGNVNQNLFSQEDEE